MLDRDIASLTSHTLIAPSVSASLVYEYMPEYLLSTGNQVFSINPQVPCLELKFG